MIRHLLNISLGNPAGHFAPSFFNIVAWVIRWIFAEWCTTLTKVLLTTCHRLPRFQELKNIKENTKNAKKPSSILGSRKACVHFSRHFSSCSALNLNLDKSASLPFSSLAHHHLLLLGGLSALLAASVLVFATVVVLRRLHSLTGGAVAISSRQFPPTNNLIISYLIYGHWPVFSFVPGIKSVFKQELMS